MLSKIVFYLILVWSNNAVASINIFNNTAVLSGHLSITNYQQFTSILKVQKVTDVKFHNCISANGLAAFRFAEKIKQMQINTIASKLVASGCSLAFLGGKTRTTDPEYTENIIQFHGAFYPDTLRSKGVKSNQETINIWEKHIGFRFGDVFKNIIVSTTKIEEGIYFVSNTKNAQQVYRTYYCDGDGADLSNLNKCNILPNIDLKTEGIITN